MSASPPDDPDDRQPPEGDGELDFDAEFERMVANWTPSEPPSAVERPPAVEPPSAVEPTSAVEPVETPTEPPPSVVDQPSAVEPPSSVVEPVETPPPSENPDERLRNLFRPVWPDPEPAAAATDPEEHFVPPPAPPIPLPEPPRLLAWAGLIGAPLLALLLLVLGLLPQWAAFGLFCWFTGGFAYLVATMRGDGRDGWDDGARV